MSVFDLDVGFSREGFELEWQLETEALWLGIYGHSGCGKTTALEVLIGWQQPTRGAVRSPALTRGLGYAPQDLLLLPHWSVEQNLLACRGGPFPDGIVDEDLYQALGLEALLGRRADGLSGGEGRRVALARALFAAPNKELLVLDEPLASLDRERRVHVLGFLLALKAVRQGPVVIVSHDATDLCVLSDVVQCVELEEGQPGILSRFTKAAKPQHALRNEGAFENLLDAKVLSIEGDLARCVLFSGEVELTVPSQGLIEGDRALFGLRSDDVLLGLDDLGRISARNRLPGRVRSLEEEGTYIKLSIDLAAGDASMSTHLTHAATRDLGLDVDSSVHLFFKTRSVRLLARLP